MNKTGVLIFILLLLNMLSVYSQNINVTTEAGELGTNLKSYNKSAITSLTVSGTIDARDFLFIRDSLLALATVDLSASSIVAYTGTGGTAGQTSKTYNAATIPENAFYQQERFVSVVLPATVTAIAKNAFNGCTKISAFTIPAGIATIDATAFRNFGGLFIVAAANNVYSSLNGVLFDKNQSTLLQAPVSLSGAYVIPSATSVISEYSFQNCKLITAVDASAISATLTIGAHAFESCTLLTGFSTNASSTVLNDAAFMSCTALTSFTAKTVSLKTYVFCYDNKLTTFTGDINEVGIVAFYGCNSLNAVNLTTPLSTVSDLAFYSCSSLAKIELPASVEKIGDNAFAGCNKITIVGGSNPLSIGSGSFSGCSLLAGFQPVLLSVGSNAFNGCAKLTAVNFAPTLTTISDNAFYGCASLGNVNLSSKVTTIGSGAFRNSTAYVSVDAANPNYSGLGGLLFNKTQTRLIQSPINMSGSYTTPQTVNTIGEYAFYNTTKLTSVTLTSQVCTIEKCAFLGSLAKIVVVPGNPCLSASQDGLVIFNADTTKLIFCSPRMTGSYSLPLTVDSVAESAFNGCNLMTSVVINPNLLSIGAAGFANSAISAINIPSSVSDMGEGAFQNCSKATTINIPASIHYIRDNTFNGCGAATVINIPDNVDSIGSYAFNNCLKWGGKLVLPLKIKYLGKAAFYNCIAKVDTLELPPLLNQISDFAFANCPKLKFVKIPSNVVSVGSYAFYGDAGLRMFVIPETVNEIKTAAFYNCSGLKSIYANDAVPIDLSNSSSVFTNVDKFKCTLYVPAGSKKLYKAASQWKDFYHIIEGKGFWIDPDTVRLSYKARADTVYIGSNTSWATNVDPTSVSWLSGAPISASGDSIITLAVDENLENQRVGYIVVRSTDSTDSIVVIQDEPKQIPDYVVGDKYFTDCDKTTYKLTASRFNIDPSLPPEDLIFNWDFGDGTVSENNTDSVIVHEFPNSTSVVNYNITLNITKLKFKKTFKATLSTIPLPDVKVVGSTRFCQGDTVVVHVTGADTYFWDYFNTTGDSIKVIYPGAYIVHGTTNDGRCKTLTFRMSTYDQNYFYIETDKNRLESFFPVGHFWTQQNDSVESYSWDFGDGTTATGMDVHHTFPLGKEYEYTITLSCTTTHGCVNTATKTITVIGKELPNTFTPNGDGVNDLFMKGWYISVCDRSGRTVYEGDTGWDGTDKGRKLPEGTYFYEIKANENGAKKSVINYVTLVRP